MPFLSLGLQNEEPQKDERGGTTFSCAATELKGANGTGESHTLPDTPASVLPAAIDELREKISERDHVAPDPSASLRADFIRGADEGPPLHKQSRRHPNFHHFQVRISSRTRPSLFRDRARVGVVWVVPVIHLRSADVASGEAGCVTHARPPDLHARTRRRQ